VNCGTRFSARFTLLNHLVIDAGIGLVAGQPLEAQLEAFAAYFSDTPMGETRRARAAEVIATQRTEFQAHDLEIGFAYADGAIVPDGSQAPPHDPMGGVYVPTTRPGHRLPHAWIAAGDETVSTHDFTENSACFVLITDEDGAAWAEAAGSITEKFGVRVKVVKIGGDEFTDATGAWASVREIQTDGAVLVRPDNHVAWRSVGSAPDPADELTRAFEAVLSR
jgi:2,4-dichlorophenol 6-monooxygenase